MHYTTDVVFDEGKSNDEITELVSDAKWAFKLVCKIN